MRNLFEVNPKDNIVLMLEELCANWRRGSFHFVFRITKEMQFLKPEGKLSKEEVFGPQSP